MRTVALLICLVFFGCAGFTVPFTKYEVAHWMMMQDQDTVNATCIEAGQLKGVARFLETRHLEYLRSHDENQALTVKEFKESLGSDCEQYLVGLTTVEIQTELFGNSVNIPNPEKLRELGGLLFAYQDITTDSGIRLTLHIEKEFTGPDRRLVVIYRLTDGKVLHYQFAGKDNVDRSTLRWPIDEFITMGAKLLIK